MNRAGRRLAAWLVMLGLVAAQLTTIAHACPLIEAALAGAQMQAGVTEPCDGMDSGSSMDITAPCVAHCQFGSDAVNTTAPDQPVHAPLRAPLVVDAPVIRAAAESRVSPVLARATAPPVFASSRRLRI
jgi:hypothetical protein